MLRAESPERFTKWSNVGKLKISFRAWSSHFSLQISRRIGVSWGYSSNTCCIARHSFTSVNTRAPSATRAFAISLPKSVEFMIFEKLCVIAITTKRFNFFYQSPRQSPRLASGLGFRWTFLMS